MFCHNKIILDYILNSMHIFNMTLYLSRIIPRLIKVTACICPTLTGRWAHVDKDTDKHSSLLLSFTDFNLKIKIST